MSAGHLDSLEIVLATAFGKNYAHVDYGIENALDALRTHLQTSAQLRDAVLEQHRNAPDGHTTSLRYCTEACRIADTLL